MAEYMFFSRDTWNMLPDRPYVEIIQNIFPEHYRIKLEMSSKKAWRENGHICEELIKQQ